MTERELFFRYLGLPSFQPIGLEITKAEGIYLYDASGKQYIDLVSGISVSNIGHRHPAVLAAIREQIEKYLYLNVYGEYIQTSQVQLAEKLACFLPENLNAVFLVNSGSEAIEGAMKLAKRFTGRTEIIAFKNGYHGSTQGALSILGNETLKNAFRPLLPDIRHLQFNSIDDLDKITEKSACVIVETIQSEAGVIIPGHGFLDFLREKCHKTGALLVIDDVQMGFGRTGRLFSFEHFGIVPDILVLAKAMGGGMPIGAFIASREIMNTLAFNPELGHITTFGGHPVSCAATLASLNVLTTTDIVEFAENRGWRIEERIKGHPLVKEIRRKGLMLGVEIVDPDIRKIFTEACLAQGLIIDWFLFNPVTFRIAPPLTISKEEVESVCDKLIIAMNSTG